MNRYVKKKKITAFLFIAVLFAFSITNIIYAFPILKQTKVEGTAAQQLAQVDTAISENVKGKYAFIELNGLVYQLLNKSEMNNFSIFKDDNGMLYLEDYADYATYYYQESRDMRGVAAKLMRLESFFEEKNTPMLFLLYPDKVSKGKTTLPNGYPYNYANETMDALKENIESSIPCLDLRDVEGIKGVASSDLFYKTDHHWKVEAAFIGFQNIVKTYKERWGIDLDPNGFYTNLENYNQIKYDSMFIGSIARKTGTQFGGVDDFTLIYPKFSTNFEYYFDMGEYKDTRSGKFEYALLNPLYFNNQEKYGSFSDTYATYLYGNSGFASIKNRTSSTNKKVLFIKDSFSLPMVSFFANTVQQVDLLDPRFYQGDIQTFLEENQYDFVVFGYSESVLQEEYIPTIQ